MAANHRISRNHACQRSATLHTRFRSSYARRLHIEELEDRRMLAITVDTNLDVVDANDNLTSLREAIAEANTAAEDTIEFADELYTQKV